MDNKINEIRRKIRALRAKMLDIEGSIRDQIKRDLDCTDASLRLMDMRRELVSLIGQRDALGGGETCPNIAERLRENYRAPVRRVLGKRISSR
jgi:hypothetical protein